MNSMIKKYVFIALCMFSFSFAYSAPVITIFVHGTQQFGTQLLPDYLWFCQQGLHHIKVLPENYMLLQDAQLLCKHKLFDIEHYYTFGWSGKLNMQARIQAGKDLAKALRKLLKSYNHEFGQYPIVRIVTFSHGGNVALHMVDELPFFEQEPIELELILIACPVQKTTQHLINSSLITRSYSIYSTKDLLQVADHYEYQGKKYFSGRIFDAQHPCCYQIKLTINNRALCHIELCHSCMRHIPLAIHAVCKKNLDQQNHMVFDITDPGFLFYNGFNIFQVLSSKRLS